MNLDASMDFLDFVAERHRIWERRQAGLPQPWTDHPILAVKKFTNVFRLLDPGSQFVINELYDPEISDRDNLMRFFLYRHTGRVETWEYLQVMMGDYPTVSTIDDARYLLKRYRETTKKPVFTSAYLVYPQSDTPGTDKLDSIFALTKRLFLPGVFTDVVPAFLEAPNQMSRFAEIRKNKGVADFMSMQVLTDWGYTQEFREDEFVVCGPGAVKGSKALGWKSAPAAHQWAVKAVRSLSDVPLLHGRPPSWMDVQNCLCEFSKFARFQLAEPARDGVRYTPAHPGAQPQPTIPRKW
jgi:hypothetical protein